MSGPYFSLGSIEQLAENEFMGICMDGRLARDSDIWCVSNFNLDNFRAMPVILRDHDPKRVIGIATAIGLINPMEVGIRGHFLPDASSDAAEAAALCRAGALKGLSAGINPDPEHIERLNDGSGGVRIVQAELLEVSLVAIPASINAKVIAARSLAARPASVALLRSLPRIPDHVIDLALEAIYLSRQPEPPAVPLFQPWNLVEAVRQSRAQHCRTVGALQMVERQREQDLSFEQRQKDLMRLSPIGRSN